jgi:mono/diheme cytochrome c family protein
MRMTEIALVLVAACGAEQQVVVPEAPEVIPATRDETHGKHLFQKFCYQCHPGGSQGVGPALDDKTLAEAAIRTQIRAGVGAMPAFPEDWLTDDQVAQIAEYVTTLHKSSPARTAFR